MVVINTFVVVDGQHKVLSISYYHQGYPSVDGVDMLSCISSLVGLRNHKCMQIPAFGARCYLGPNYPRSHLLGVFIYILCTSICLEIIRISRVYLTLALSKRSINICKNLSKLQ